LLEFAGVDAGCEVQLGRSSASGGYCGFVYIGGKSKCEEPGEKHKSIASSSSHMGFLDLVMNLAHETHLLATKKGIGT